MEKSIKHLDDVLSAGRKAFRLGVLVTANPYTDGGERWAWQSGWDNEQRLEPKKVREPRQYVPHVVSNEVDAEYWENRSKLRRGN